MRPLVAVVLLLITTNAAAHDLITAELAEGYLNKALRWHEQSETDTDTSERAKAYLRIGVMLDEIRGYLNRDLAAHGEVQGLASNYLVAELKRVGTPLAYSESRNFFTANSEYYRAALEMGLNSTLAREARLRLLRGEFYDSFDVDPLQTDQSAGQLQQSVALVEQLLETVTREPDLEEVRFIAAIVYARAARAATDAAASAEFRGKALAHVDAFTGDYPDSLRSAAMPVVRAALYDPR
jgi:hypothetical protein